MGGELEKIGTSLGRIEEAVQRRKLAGAALLAALLCYLLRKSYPD